MHVSSGGRTDDIEVLVHTYGDNLYRLCLVMLGHVSDAEDAVQETFLKYLQKTPAFSGPEHEKAWLITVATNQCRDILRIRKRRPHIPADDLPFHLPAPAESGILEALMSIPEHFRLVLTLYYVEEYPIADIARIIGKTTSAVKMRLRKGRLLLAEAYRKEYL